MESFNMNALSDLQKIWYNRFLSKINKEGRDNSSLDAYKHLTRCWSHNTSPSSSGYGQIMLNYKLWNLHRFSWWIHNGCPSEEDYKNKHIIHACDNKECSNPEHLSIGTPKENAEDVWKRQKQKKVKEVIRNSEPCLECVKHHKKCDGKIPCSYCSENSLECIKKEYKQSPGCFQKGIMTGERNVKCSTKEAEIEELLLAYFRGDFSEYGKLKEEAERRGKSYVWIQKIVSGKLWSSVYERVKPS